MDEKDRRRLKSAKNRLSWARIEVSNANIKVADDSFGRLLACPLHGHARPRSNLDLCPAQIAIGEYGVHDVIDLGGEVQRPSPCIGSRARRAGEGRRNQIDHRPFFPLFQGQNVEWHSKGDVS